MTKSVGYGVVGLAAVLLGVLIVVPFVKDFFVSQLDGYIDYSATFLTFATENAASLNSYITSGNIAKLMALQSSYQNNLSSTPVTDPTYVNIQNKLMLVTLAINALNGDVNSNIIAKKIVNTIPAADPTAVPVPVPVPVPVKTAVTVGAAPVGVGQVVPSLSVNVSKPSSTLDIMKSACQSLLSDTTLSLTGVAAPPGMAPVGKTFPA